jgi:hypothetical protein
MSDDGVDHRPDHMQGSTRHEVPRQNLQPRELADSFDASEKHPHE